MYISISGALLNTVLDVLLIFGVEGLIPSLGIEGAAWASFIAQCLMCLLAIVFLLKKTSFDLKLSLPFHKEFSSMIGLSSGFIIRTLALNLTFFLANRYATSYGPEYIAAHTIAINIWLFSSYFIDGYANAGNALAGRLIGAGAKDELFNVGSRLLKISIAIGAALSLCYLLLYPWLGSFFSKDPAVIDLFNAMFWMVILAQPLNSIAFSLDGIFKGLGRAKLLMNTLLIAAFLGFMPLLFLSDHMGWALFGIWSALIFFMAIRGATLFSVFYGFRPSGE